MAVATERSYLKKMPDKNFIQSYVSLRNNQAAVNGKYLPIPQELSSIEFLKAIYHFLQLDYPKFFKMDELCKLAFISAELLLKDFPLQNPSENEVAIILSNASSTLETDQKYQESIKDEQNYFPSPAVFVYTLPNITIGEIAIRHKLQGENTFFVSEQYDPSCMVPYVNSMLQHNRAQRALSGWVEFSSGSYDGFLYLAGKEKTGLSIEHSTENIEKLYKIGHSV